MSTAGIIFQAIGTELAMYGQLRAGQIAHAVHRSNAEAIKENAANQAAALVTAAGFDERNAQIAEQEAVLAHQIAAYQERRFRTAAAYREGYAVARAGASGADISSGSTLLALGTVAYEQELDALAIRYSGELQVRAREEQATLLRYQRDTRYLEAQSVRRQGAYSAALERFAGSQAMTGAYIGATTTLVNSLASMSGGGSMGGAGGAAGAGGGGGAA